MRTKARKRKREQRNGPTPAEQFCQAWNEIDDRGAPSLSQNHPINSIRVLSDILDSKIKYKNQHIESGYSMADSGGRLSLNLHDRGDALCSGVSSLKHVGYTSRETMVALIKLQEAARWAGVRDVPRGPSNFYSSKGTLVTPEEHSQYLRAPKQNYKMTFSEPAPSFWDDITGMLSSFTDVAIEVFKEISSDKIGNLKLWWKQARCPGHEWKTVKVGKSMRAVCVSCDYSKPTSAPFVDHEALEVEPTDDLSPSTSQLVQLDKSPPQQSQCRRAEKTPNP